MEVECRRYPKNPEYLVGSDGSIWSTKSPSSIFTSPDGYKILLSKSSGSSQRRYRVHRMVLESFVGDCPIGMVCCHNNGNPSDNRLENLRWGTPKSNSDDAKRHGRVKCGESHRRSKLSNNKVLWIRMRYSCGESAAKIGNDFGVCGGHIKNIVARKSWAHV